MRTYLDVRRIRLKTPLLKVDSQRLAANDCSEISELTVLMGDQAGLLKHPQDRLVKSFTTLLCFEARDLNPDSFLAPIQPRHFRLLQPHRARPCFGAGPDRSLSRLHVSSLSLPEFQK